MSKTPSIPDHRLLRLIASGGYGEVWLGCNAVETFRAVKIMRRDQHVSPLLVEREFNGLRKFEPLSRAHPGLVDILTLGLLPDGTRFPDCTDPDQHPSVVAIILADEPLIVR